MRNKDIDLARTSIGAMRASQKSHWRKPDADGLWGYIVDKKIFDTATVNLYILIAIEFSRSCAAM